MQVRVAELRDAEVETPGVPVGGRRDEAASLEDLQKIGHARPGSTQPLGQLPRGEPVLAPVDEQQQQVEGPSCGASDRACLRHGARR